MFPYSDPTATGLLAQLNALDPFRSSVHASYVRGAQLPGSAFTLLNAFEDEAVESRLDAVSWRAFPRNVEATNEEIDSDRLNLQEEYVEWQVIRQHDQPVQVTFTTEFAEYYAAFAAEGLAALVTAVQAVYPGANPTALELFGTAAHLSAASRWDRFLAHLQQNPWVNGEKGIICLAHRSNTLGALIGLLAACAVPRDNLQPGQVCAAVNTACVPGRNSDPSVCSAVQALARAGRAVSAADPIGIQIAHLDGIWKLNGQQIDLNDPAHSNIWQISRNGRRAVFNIVPQLTKGDEPIESGAQIAASVRVQATVISANENDIPTWAQMGEESSRAIV